MYFYMNLPYKILFKYSTEFIYRKLEDSKLKENILMII